MRQSQVEELCKNTQYSFVKWETVYQNQKSKFICNCATHGCWSVAVVNFIGGRRCPKCRGGVRINTQTFKEKAIKIHGDKYDYSESVYPANNHSLISISCKIHGKFYQKPNHHLNGCGCPKCGKYGFDSTEKSTIYGLRSTCGSYVKIGITKNPTRRFKELTKATPFEFNVVERIDCSGGKALDFETMFHRHFESAKFTGFDGATEWLLWKPEIQNWLRFLSS